MRYLPEILLLALETVHNVVVVLCTAWVVIRLFELSHSFLSMSALMMLAGLKTCKFTRD